MRGELACAWVIIREAHLPNYFLQWMMWLTVEGWRMPMYEEYKDILRKKGPILEHLVQLSTKISAHTSVVLVVFNTTWSKFCCKCLKWVSNILPWSTECKVPAHIKSMVQYRLIFNSAKIKTYFYHLFGFLIIYI